MGYLRDSVGVVLVLILQKLVLQKVPQDNVRIMSLKQEIINANSRCFSFDNGGIALVSNVM
jgi:hypothetical protein